MPTSPTLRKLKTEAARSFLRDVTNVNDIFHVFFGKTDAWRRKIAGSITTTNGSPVVTGLGSSFSSEIHFGSRLYKNDGATLIGIVLSIESNTSLTLTASCATGSGNVVTDHLMAICEDDGNPPTVEDTRFDDAEAHTNIMAVKRIGREDTAYLIPNVSWAVNTVFDRYTDDADLSTLNFYVYNPDNLCIYKCLNRQDYIDHNVGVSFPVSPVSGDFYTSGLYKWKYNGTSWEMVSTVIPSDSSGTEKFRTIDGYWWKMIYKISDIDKEKFIDPNNTTLDYLPVRFIPSSVSYDCTGHIGDITITNSGSGYTTAPSVIFTGDGEGAYATASINTYGEVVDITVIAEGRGYSFMYVSFTGGNGSGCTATANLVPDTPIPEDPNVMVSATAEATAGAIEFIDILDGGQNYSQNSQFSIVGDGKDATLSVSIDLDGKVASIQTNIAGKGYTYASIISSGSGEGAVFKPIISPIWGHGGNVPTELLASVVGIVVDVTSPYTPPTPEGDFFRGNDFRQVGVIKNIRAYGTYGNVFSDDTGDACYKIVVSDVSNYNIDDVIVSNDGGRFVVVEINPYDPSAVGDVVKLLPIADKITSGSTLSNETTSSVPGPDLAPIVSMTAPEINKKTGDIIYLKNTSPYLRQVYQTESVKLYLQF